MGGSREGRKAGLEQGGDAETMFSSGGVPCSQMHEEAGNSEAEGGTPACPSCPPQHYFLNQEFQNYNVYHTPWCQIGNWDTKIWAF